MSHKVIQHMKETWGAEKGKSLYEHYNKQTQATIHSSHERQKLVKHRMDNIDNMISELEAILELKEI